MSIQKNLNIGTSAPQIYKPSVSVPSVKTPGTSTTRASFVEGHFVGELPTASNNHHSGVVFKPTKNELRQVLSDQFGISNRKTNKEIKERDWGRVALAVAGLVLGAATFLFFGVGYFIGKAAYSLLQVDDKKPIEPKYTTPQQTSDVQSLIAKATNVLQQCKTVAKKQSYEFDSAQSKLLAECKSLNEAVALTNEELNKFEANLGKLCNDLIETLPDELEQRTNELEDSIASAKDKISQYKDKFKDQSRIPKEKKEIINEISDIIDALTLHKAGARVLDKTQLEEMMTNLDTLMTNLGKEKPKEQIIIRP